MDTATLRNDPPKTRRTYSLDDLAALVSEGPTDSIRAAKQLRRRAVVAEIETAELAAKPRPTKRQRATQSRSTADALRIAREQIARWSR